MGYVANAVVQRHSQTHTPWEPTALVHEGSTCEGNPIVQQALLVQSFSSHSGYVKADAHLVSFYSILHCVVGLVFYLIRGQPKHETIFTALLPSP